MIKEKKRKDLLTQGCAKRLIKSSIQAYNNVIALRQIMIIFKTKNWKLPWRNYEEIHHDKIVNVK